MAYKTVTDQLNKLVRFSFPPKRIISLVPSQTELLFDLGLDKEIVGITKFCIHPARAVQTKTIIGGTKKLWIDKIKSLKPELIIGNREENSKGDIENLSLKYPIWMSDIFTLNDALSMISEIGVLTNRDQESASMIHRIEERFQAIKKQPAYLFFI